MKKNNNLNLMVSKCIIHPKQTYVGICMNDHCGKKQLACAKCLVFFHSDHPKSIVFFADLKDSQNLLLKPWDAGIEIQKLEQSLNSALNIDKQTEKKLRQLQKSIYEIIDEQKMKALKNIMIYQNNSIKSSKVLQNNYKISYSIKHLQQHLAKFLTGKLTQNEFNQIIDKIINSRSQLDKTIINNNYSHNSHKNNQIVSQTMINDIIYNTITQINKLDQIIVKPIYYAWDIIKNKFSNKFIKIIEPNSVFEFSAEGQNQIIYGSLMKQKPLTFLITIDLLKQQKDQKFRQEKKKVKRQNKRRQRSSSAQESQSQRQQIVEIQQNKQQQPKQDIFNGLKNIYIGFIQEQYKQDEKMYIRRPVTFGGYPAQSYDIITGTVIGSFMNVNQYYGGFNRFQGRTNLFQFVKSNLQTNHTIDLMYFFDPAGRITISDKNKKTSMQCKHFYNNTFGQGASILNIYRPFILCNRSEVRISIKELNSMKSDRAGYTSRSGIPPAMIVPFRTIPPIPGFGGFNFETTN